jgi:hypothetical protein
MGVPREGLEAVEEKNILVLMETELQFSAHSAHVPDNTPTTLYILSLVVIKPAGNTKGFISSCGDVIVTLVHSPLT